MPQREKESEATNASTSERSCSSAGSAMPHQRKKEANSSLPRTMPKCRLKISDCSACSGLNDFVDDRGHAEPADLFVCKRYFPLCWISKVLDRPRCNNGVQAFLTHTAGMHAPRHGALCKSLNRSSGGRTDGQHGASLRNVIGTLSAHPVRRIGNCETVAVELLRDGVSQSCRR